MADVADSTDDRVSYRAGHEPDLPMMRDGVADYNGRFANPPFLFGSGGVELLAKEMTYELQAQYQEAYDGYVGKLTRFVTKGVDFGYARTVGYHQVELHLQGIGPIEVDPDHPETALVVAPFGRKGENFSVRDFDRGATQFHFGIQPVEVWRSTRTPTTTTASTTRSRQPRWACCTCSVSATRRPYSRTPPTRRGTASWSSRRSAAASATSRCCGPTTGCCRWPTPRSATIRPPTSTVR